MVRSRRKAREAALRACYELDLGDSALDDVVASTLAEADLAPELARYAERAVRGVAEHREELDATISARIREYDFSRVAAVDRNVLRIASYELFHEPSIPPAVTIDEAVMIAKRYSTAESGRFVNGVLGAVLADSPKADWDRTSAPTEFEEAPDDETGSEPEPEVETVEDMSDLPKAGLWKIRSDGTPP